MYTRAIIGASGSELDFVAPNWNPIEGRVAASVAGQDGKPGLPGPTGK